MSAPFLCLLRGVSQLIGCGPIRQQASDHGDSPPDVFSACDLQAAVSFHHAKMAQLMPWRRSLCRRSRMECPRDLIPSCMAADASDSDLESDADCNRQQMADTRRDGQLGQPLV